MRTADMHCDTIGVLYREEQKGGKTSLRKNGLQVDLEKMKAGGYFLQNFAMFVDLEETDRPFETCVGMIDLFYREMEKNRDLISPVTSWEEIRENEKQGRMCALLTLEEGEVCQGDPALLRTLYRLGARMMTLTWNYENSLAFPGRADGTPETERGLKQRGLEMVEEMERLGMIVDVAHLSDQGIRDVLQVARKPFVASHSNARSLAFHPRNLTDELIRAIGGRGGVIGVNYYWRFLEEIPENGRKMSRILRMVEHMKHLKNVGGIECIGLGSDFDGISGEVELESAAGLPLLAQAMEKEGFLPSEIEAVFAGNVLRLYRELL